MAVQDPDTAANGIKIGEGRLHPYFDFEMRYDSYAGIKNGLNGEPFPEVLAHFRPGLNFDLPNPNFDFSVGGDVDYVFYTGILDPSDRGFSRLEGAANLSLAINRPGAVEFDISDTLQRSDRSRNVAVGVGVVSLFNEVRAAVPIHPGGRALEVTPHGAFAVEYFEPLACASFGLPCADVTNVAAQNYQNINAGLDARLRFLPKTAIVLNTGMDLRNYPNGGANTPDVKLLNATLGLAGLLTNRIAVVLKAGWGQDFGATRASSVIGQAELAYLPNDLTTLKIGFIRVFQPVPLFGTYLDNKPYLDVRTLLGGRLALHLNAAYDFLQFSSSDVRAGRVDQVMYLDAGPQFEFTRWLIGSLGFLYSRRMPGATDGTGPIATLQYQRLEGYARITFTY